MSVKEFTVKRSEWYRGKGGCGSALAVFKGDDFVGRCCLGFLGGACGLIDPEMTDVPFPSCIRDRVPEWPIPTTDERGRPLEGNGFEGKVARINDDQDIDDATRETELTKLFAANGVTIHFVD